MTASPSLYRGRFAPSPTGRLHLGVARTALITWLCARRAGGRLILRVEDLDGPRAVPGASEQIAEDLHFLGLDWDEGFLRGGCHSPYLQSQRSALYEAALGRLQAQGLVFSCSCSRREVAEASTAPHGDLGPLYPGTCRAGATQSERPCALRFAMPDRPEPFDDGVFGPQSLAVRDDFVVRRADGLFAYQLAVVIDDIAMGVTEVVRGADLLSSTPRQLALYRALGASPPRFVHVPLVLGSDGTRLSKRHGSLSIAELRGAGHSAAAILGVLATSAGLLGRPQPVTAEALLENFSLSRLPREPALLSEADFH